MALKISAWGGGLAAILGAGAVLLAALQNGNWPLFLFAAIFVFLISTASKKLR
ncbi:hypothetical protein JXB11_04155 [Candidatus Woesearchaeota archaeon]|nr:hypothetical protein [Candidatus Woesearchaeota archaeon]